MSTFQTSIDFDITARKHRGNPNSVAAHERVKGNKLSMKEKIFASIVMAGVQGRTLKEVADEFGKLPHQISGRLSELAYVNREIYTIRGNERSGYGVWVAEMYRNGVARTEEVQ